MGKALIYRRGALGDTLLTFPLLEILKSKGYEVTAVGNTDYFSIAREAGWADVIHFEIPREKFDFVLDISIDGNIKPFPEEREWIVDYYLRKAGFEGEPYSDEIPLEMSKSSPFIGRVAIAPSSGSLKKVPNISFFEKLERYLFDKGYEPLYIVGEADGWIAETFKPVYVIEDLVKFAKDLKASLFYIGVDSGISHLASYLGIRSYVIFGPTDPIVWRPIGRRLNIIYLNPDCGPCFPEVCEERSCLDENILLRRLGDLLGKDEEGNIPSLGV